MSINQKDQFFWCSFEAHEGESMVIEYVVLGSQIAIFSTIAYAYVKAKRQNQLNQISTVYKLILIWLILMFLKTTMNVIAYFVYIQNSPSNSQNNNFNPFEKTEITGLRIMSSIFSFLDPAATFFLQITMIYIPYLWMKNALQLLIDYNLQVQERIKINRISGSLRLVKKYLIIRNIYFLFFIAVSIAIGTSDIFKQLIKYKFIVSMTQAIIILIVYPLGFRTFNLVKDKITLSQRQSKSMFIEYIILICCNVIRIIVNTIYYFTDIVPYQPDQYCYDDHSERQTMINCIYLVISLGLMHILPGSMILYIYWPSKKDKFVLKDSVLMNSSETRIS